MHHSTTLGGVSAAARTETVSGVEAGTVILTMEGELPVEHLAPGDRIITRDLGAVRLGALTVAEAEVQPIRLKAGSLGHTRPERDLRMGPGTRVHVRDWRAPALYGRPAATVAAHRLVDGEFVTREPRQRLRLFRLVFDTPHIVYADGLEIATG